MCPVTVILLPCGASDCEIEEIGLRFMKAVLCSLSVNYSVVNAAPFESTASSSILLTCI